MNSLPRATRPWKPVSLLPWSVAVLAAAFGLRQLDSTDTWWHLAAGRWIFENRRVPWTDPFSFTAVGHEWIDLQWLFDLTIFAVHRVGGVTALVLSKALLFTATVACLVPLVRRHAGPLTTTVLLGWVVVVCQQRVAVRPELLSFFLLVILMQLLGAARRGGRVCLWLLPLLMLVWVNVHALFVVGLLLIGCAVVSDVTTGPSGAGRIGARLWLAAAVAAGATLCNPYGLTGALFPLQLPSRFDRESVYRAIGEFQGSFFAWWPNWSLGGFQLYLIGASAVVAFAAATSFRRDRGSDGGASAFDPGEMLAFAVLATLAVLARRNAALFVLGTAPFVARCLRRAARSLPPLPSRAATAASVGVTLGLAGSVWAVAGSHYYRWDAKSHRSGLGVLEGRFPEAASRFVVDTALPGPMFNDLSSGGWLAWSRPTREGVFIDGRLEVYDRHFADYLEMLGDPEHWKVRADAWRLESALIYHRYRNRHPLIRALLADPAWEPVYADESAIVFLRARGNTAALARARPAYAALLPSIERRLLAPPSGWGNARGRAMALSAYARLLSLVGRRDAAARFFERAIEVGLARGETLAHAVWLAGYHLSAGREEAARLWLERARRIDPDHPAVRSLSGRLL